MCISCAILRPINDTAENYAIRIFDVLAPNALQLFQAFVGIWLVSIIFKLLKGQITVEEVMTPILVFSLVIFALAGHQFFWEYVYRPISETTVNLLTTIIGATNRGQQARDLMGLLEAVELAIDQILVFCERIYGSAGWNNITPLIMGLLLSFPFLFLWAIFMLYTAEYVFKLLVISALSPLLIVAAAFKVSRSYAMSALKVVLQGILTVAISVIAMGVALAAIDNASTHFRLIDGSRIVVNEFSVFSVRFCSLFALGLTAVLFQLKAPAIASNISGSHDGPGAAGLIAASMGALLWKGLRGGNKPKPSGSHGTGDNGSSSGVGGYSESVSQTYLDIQRRLLPDPIH